MTQPPMTSQQPNLGQPMVRRIVVGAAIAAAAAICTAPVAAADDVPGMDYNAVRGAACQTSGFLYIFGRVPSRTALLTKRSAVRSTNHLVTKRA
jgi:hypothetical protein